MSWQDELITSQTEADHFLRRQLTATGILPLHFEVNKEGGMNFSAETEVSGRKENILSFEIGLQGGGGTYLV